MNDKTRDLEKKDTEEFVKDILMKVPKGSARNTVLAVTGAVAATATALIEKSNGKLNNGGTTPASP